MGAKLTGSPFSHAEKPFRALATGVSKNAPFGEEEAGRGSARWFPELDTVARSPAPGVRFSPRLGGPGSYLPEGRLTGQTVPEAQALAIDWLSRGNQPATDPDATLA